MTVAKISGRCEASMLESCKSPSLGLRNSPWPKRPFGLSCVVEYAIEGSSRLVRLQVQVTQAAGHAQSLGAGQG